MLQMVIALIVYPGLLLTLVLSIISTVIIRGRLRLHYPVLLAAGRSVEGVVYSLSILLAAIGLALMPWSLHPLSPTVLRGLWAWAAFEAAFLLPLLPALLAGMPPIVRAASREAQMGVMGRILLWIGLSTGMLLPFGGDLLHLLAYVLAALTAVLAFPVAAGWGPFAAETSLTPGGVEYGLDIKTALLADAARTVRTTALLAASLVALIPLTVLQPWLRLILIAGLFVLICVVLRQLTGRMPRLPLPTAIRMCLWRTLPLSMAALMYLALASR